MACCLAADVNAAPRLALERFLVSVRAALLERAENSG